jgi:hypothetical protein
MPRLCDFETCRKQATYGEQSLKPLRCKEHKGEYVLVNSLCEEGICKSRPIYNYVNESKPKYCLIHRKDNMLNVITKKCKMECCNISPKYNFEGYNSPLYCTSHKKTNMVNIISKKCEYDGCKISPTFNFENEIFALYCALHKKENMVNVTKKKCEYDGCKLASAFNYENEKKGKYCSLHKNENMVNVISKKCEYDGCKIQPTFNYENEKTALYCALHKKTNMIDINNKKCEYIGCNTIPIFNFKGKTQSKFCNLHKEELMLNIKDKTCKAYDESKQEYYCKTTANKKYKGYCSNCYQNLFPLDPLSYQIRCKTKEIAVRDYINAHFEAFQHDKPLFTGNCDCSNRRRIDHRILIGNTLLCVETDENQHKSYDKKDEEIRYDDLYMIHSGKFIFIRFNPDKYINKNNKSVNPMLYTRLPILKEEIEKQIERIKKEENTELLEIIKLYYTGYN